MDLYKKVLSICFSTSATAMFEELSNAALQSWQTTVSWQSNESPDGRRQATLQTLNPRPETQQNSTLLLGAGSSFFYNMAV